MPITFQDDNEIIVYALQRIISHARQSQQIFVAQCVWWLASICGLEQRLVHIDKLHDGSNIVPQQPIPRLVSDPPERLAKDQRHDQVLRDTEQYLKESKQLRSIAALKSSGNTASGRINPTRVSKRRLRKARKVPKVNTVREPKYYSKTEGLEISELERRKTAGECLRCAWPSDRKGSHTVADCRRPINLDKGTAEYPKAKDKACRRISVSAVVGNLEDSTDCENSGTTDDASSSGL